MARVEIARKYACGVDRFVHRLVIVHFRATYNKSLWTDLGCGKLRIKGKRSVLEKNALYHKKKGGWKPNIEYTVEGGVGGCPERGQICRRKVQVTSMIIV